jgi:hypothetical protein
MRYRELLAALVTLDGLIEQNPGAYSYREQRSHLILVVRKELGWDPLPIRVAAGET